MEVHQHSHTPRKKWTHYFWEFFMLFLAVFCGFLAENQREHYIEHKREKQYIRLFIKDLEKDTANLQPWIKWGISKKQMMDSLMKLLISGKHRQSGNDTYFFARSISRGFRFLNADGTMQQLKNSGGFRLIRNQRAIDSMIEYDAAVKSLEIQAEGDYEIQKKFKEIAGDVFEAKVFYEMIDSNFQIIRPVNNPQLITNNQVIINKIAFQVQYQSAILLTNVNGAKYLNTKATRLIEFLKEEYNLE